MVIFLIPRSFSVKKVLGALLSLNCLLVYASLSQIYTTDSLDKLYELLPTLSSTSLVIFDRDDTLLQGFNCMDTEQQNKCISLWKEIYTTEDPTSLLHNIALQQPVLVDQRAPELIKKLQTQGAQVIILTRGCYGMGPTGQHVEDLCSDAFKKVGIDLQESFASYSGLVLADVVYKGNCPLFKQGILFSNTCDKGHTLEAFLTCVGFVPDHVVFVDDKLPYLQEVQRAMQKQNIPFLGLHYRGATKLSVPDLRTHCYRMCYVLERDLC